MPAEEQSGRELAERGIAEAAYPTADQSVEGWAIWNGESQDHLHELIESQPDLLGDPVVDQFGKGSLPFLFKVLSVSGSL